MRCSSRSCETAQFRAVSRSCTQFRAVSRSCAQFRAFSRSCAHSFARFRAVSRRQCVWVVGTPPGPPPPGEDPSTRGRRCNAPRASCAGRARAGCEQRLHGRPEAPRARLPVGAVGARARGRMPGRRVGVRVPSTGEGARAHEDRSHSALSHAAPAHCARRRNAFLTPVSPPPPAPLPPVLTGHVSSLLPY
jgi:hypothetical protein